MKKATIEATYSFIMAMEGQSDDSVTLALQKEFAFKSSATYSHIKDLVQVIRKLKKPKVKIVKENFLD